MSSSPKIIINADDLGFSPQVNAAILRCAELGTVTAASVMVNMPFAESAFQQVRELYGLFPVEETVGVRRK